MLVTVWTQAMACTVYQPWNPGLVKSSDEEDHGCQHKLKESRRVSHDLLDCRGPLHLCNRSSRLGSVYTDSKHRATYEPLWTDASRVSEERRRTGKADPTQAHNGELCESYGVLCVTHDRARLRNDECTAFVALLRACALNRDLHRGTRVHYDILKRGMIKKCSDALVTMYAKCGAVAKAKELIDMYKSRNVYSWTALIVEYARQGRGEDALNCFEQMQCDGLSPDAVTLTCILNACSSMRAASKGGEIHDEIARRGLFGSNIVLDNALVNMYTKCGDLQKAQRVLEQLPCRDVVSWNTLIAGYAQQGQGVQVLNCFKQMQHEGLSPNTITFACILKACGSMKDVNKGEQIHDEIARQGLLGNSVVLGNALVDMYVKCGALVKAQRVLEGLSSRDVVSWNSLLAGYAQQGQGEQALECFERLKSEGVLPDAVTFTCILKACGSIKAADKGEQIHYAIARQGLLEQDIVLGNALVDMYVKCGALAKAECVLEELPSRNVVSWSALIVGYAQQGQGEQALNCFERMRHEDLSPNAVTFSSILKACGTIGAIDKGEQIHDEIARQGLLGNDVVLGGALVDMYAKCGALTKAQAVLEELPVRNVSSWSALIRGYAKEGQGEQALHCFEQMQREGLAPDIVTFVCIVSACSSIGAVDKGEQIHDQIVRQGLLGKDLVLGNALVDMYAKCGALAKAHQVLEELPSRNVVSWNALIGGYAQEGQGEESLICFKRMQDEGLTPNAVTFSCVLTACNHLGLVEDGHMYFVNMSTKYGIKPALEHYTCMVDLFGRAGHLDKVVGVIQEMPLPDSSAVWCALLGACRKWGDVDVARWAFEQAVQKDKSDAAAYVLMADIYATAGMQEDAEDIEAKGMENKAWKVGAMEMFV